MTVDISLIVCTRNRTKQLPTMLESLRRLNFAGTWEVVIVDNGSTDNTPIVIATFAKSAPFPLTVVPEPRRGLARARNRGLSHAKGTIAAFTDDDCYPAANYLTTLRHSLDNDQIAYCGGRVLLYDPTDCRVTIQEKSEREVIPPRSFIPAGLIHGANMAFRTDVLTQLRGFDERLGAGTPFKSGEDTDMLVRCSAAGYLGVYEPTIVVHHHHGRKAANQVALLKAGHATGRGACLAKYCANRTTRDLYLRRWYWRLRKSRWSVVAKELLAATHFTLRYGLTPRPLWEHPDDSLLIRRSTSPEIPA